MSFRDLRSFTEMMRALSYPRLISLENFRKPNFPLVSEILVWLVHRFDPDADIVTDSSSEQERVMLIRSAVQFLLNKVHIRLNAKKVYQADGHAVKEIIKVTSILYNAMKENANINFDDPPEKERHGLNMLDISSKINEIKLLRQLANEITTKGSTLYEMLTKEVDLREARAQVLDRQIELTEVESALQKTIGVAAEEIKQTRNLIENVASNEANLDAKIKKKQIELERTQKRLQTLKKVRPAFMDEYERLEIELKDLYSEYIDKYRCLAYLEKLMADHDKQEQERMEEKQAATRKLLERLRHEDFTLRTLEGSAELLSGEESESDEGVLPPSKPKERTRTVRNKTAAANGPSGKPVAANIRRVFGSMTGGEDDSASLGSDSDLILDGGDGDEGSDLDSDELEVENAPGRKTRMGGAAAGGNQPVENGSDDDF